MKNRSISPREVFTLVLLAVLVVGLSYYWFFFKPLNEDLAAIATQTADTEAQVDIALAKRNAMDMMQAELTEIFSRPADEISEIAPYDNATVIYSELNNILYANCEEYSISFKDPVIQEDGIVRRAVNMSFACSDYASAKTIVQALADSHWRCLINSLAISSANQSDGDIQSGPVTVQTTFTFIESTKLD